MKCKAFHLLSNLLSPALTVHVMSEYFGYHWRGVPVFALILQTYETLGFPDGFNLCPRPHAPGGAGYCDLFFGEKYFFGQTGRNGLFRVGLLALAGHVGGRPGVAVAVAH